MKKLIILKSIVDFIWIVTCIPLILLVLFLMVYQFIDTDIISSLTSSNSMTNSLIPLHIIIIVFGVIVLLLIYSLYLFRKTIRYFQKQNPFDVFVSTTYNTIGKTLILSGFVGSILSVTHKFIYKSKLVFNLGLSPYLLIICLGLFFMLLSETFKVAKKAKDENDLTI